MLNVYMTDEIKLVEKTRDDWGEETLTLTVLPARVDYKITRWLDAKGEEVISEKIVTIAFRAGLSLDSRVEVEGLTWPIKKIARPTDFSWKFLELYL